MAACSEEYLKRTIIPAGTSNEQVLLSLIDVLDNRYSIWGFYVDNARNFYFQEEGTGKIKVFTESGQYLRTLKDHNCESLFLYGNEFIGQRINKDKIEELIFFSSDSSEITYSTPLALGAGRWIAYKIVNGFVVFSPTGLDYGTKKAFDIKKKKFVTEDINEWDKMTERTIISNYFGEGAEAIGKINDYYLFRFPPLPKDTSYEYSLRAAKVEAGKIAHMHVLLKRQDVGIAMQGLVGTIIDNRYIYTIGHPQVPQGKQPDIWITRIDLKILMPGLW